MASSKSAGGIRTCKRQCPLEGFWDNGKSPTHTLTAVAAGGGSPNARVLPDGGQSGNCTTTSHLKRLTLYGEPPENHTAATPGAVSGVRPTEGVRRSQELHKKYTAFQLHLV
jgi:hypothetical protein